MSKPATCLFCDVQTIDRQRIISENEHSNAIRDGLDFPRCSRQLEPMISSQLQTMSPTRFTPEFKDEAVR